MSSSTARRSPRSAAADALSLAVATTAELLPREQLEEEEQCVVVCGHPSWVRATGRTRQCPSERIGTRLAERRLIYSPPPVMSAFHAVVGPELLGSRVTQSKESDAFASQGS